MVHVLRSQVALAEGDRDGALRHARLAQEDAHRHGYRWATHSMQWLQGTLEGGQHGAAQCAAALDFFANEGWKKPERAARLNCPLIRE